MSWLKTKIQSRWGALASFFLIESYAMILGYIFINWSSQFSKHLISGLAGEEPSEFEFIFLISTCLILLFFIKQQSHILNDVLLYLKNNSSLSDWISELKEIKSLINFFITVPIIFFYVQILLGKIDIGLEPPNTFILILLHLLHPLINKTTNHIFKGKDTAIVKYVSLRSHILTIASSVAVGLIVYCLSDYSSPQYLYFFRLFGITFIIYGLTTFLLENFEGKKKEILNLNYKLVNWKDK